jgi:hypothetical protein
LKDPRRKPATLPASMRADARSVADLYRFWHSKGYEVNSIGELLRWSVETFHELILSRNKGEFKPTETQEEARQILLNAGFRTAGLRKAQQRIVKEFQKESLDDFFETVEERDPKESLQDALKQLGLQVTKGKECSPPGEGPTEEPNFLERVRSAEARDSAEQRALGGVPSPQPEDEKDSE